MKFIPTAVIIILTFISTSATAQDANSLINTHIEKTGGRENWERIDGIKMTTSVNFKGFNLPMSIISTSDGKQAMIAQPFGQDIVLFASDGKTSWAKNPMTLQTEKLSEDQADQMKKISDIFPNPLLRYRKNGFVANLVGNATVGGKNTFKIELKETESMDTTIFYLDTTTYLPVRIEKTVNNELNTIEIKAYQTIDGMVFPVKFSRNGTDAEINTIVLNPEIDQNLFKFPG
ncbi:hypothetical protein ACJRPK_11930 [Aquimarina sp. 2-A2]|uniref:hypothetical protein n=1 Tax=Aquimarina sp. 2-A2 TaxID=3382644 RepID=UPI00387F0C0E